MTRRIAFLGLLCGLLTAGTGCNVMHRIVYEPFGPGSICTPSRGGCGCDSCYDSGCGATCDQGCATCDTGCGTACETTCGPDVGCSDGACAQPGAPFGPLSWIACLFHTETWYGDCCGEWYLGDFHGDPPECCDPCNRHGDFTGMRGDGCNSGHCGSSYGIQPSGGCPTCNQGVTSVGENAAGRSQVVRVEQTPQLAKTYRDARR